MVNMSRRFRKMAGVLALTLTMSTAFSGMTLMAYAEQTCKVNTDVLNIRSGPSTYEDILGTVTKGQEFTILDSSNGFYKISSGGVTGYISSEFVTVSGQGTTSGTTGKVNVSILNVRKSPSTDAQTLGTLSSGTQVSILGKEGSWYKVSITLDGVATTGYVAAQYITTSGNVPDTPVEPTPASGSGKVNVDALNIRQSASTDSDVLGSLVKGASVTIIGTTGTWYKVTATVNGKSVTGFVYAQYITKSADPAPDTQTNAKTNDGPLNVRSSASTSAEILGTIEKGTKLAIISESGDWYKVKVTLGGKEVTGYVAKKYVTKDGQPDPTPTPDPTPSGNTVGKVTSGPLNVRKSASTSGEILGTIEKGTQVTITGESGDWYKINVTIGGKSVTGYASKTYISKTGTEYTEQNAGQAQTEDFVKTLNAVNEKVYATTGVNIRSGPGTSYTILAGLAKDQEATRTGVQADADGWSRIKYGSATGYVKSEFLTTTKPSKPTPSVSATELVNFAKKYEGNPYKWGGNSLTDGVDCSGFTQQVYLHFGISINRSADAQRKDGVVVAKGTVKKSDLQPGDLVFYGSSSYAEHVALYIGNGKVIHASSPSVGIIISDFNYRTPTQANRIL